MNFRECFEPPVEAPLHNLERVLTWYFKLFQPSLKLYYQKMYHKIICPISERAYTNFIERYEYFKPHSYMWDISKINEQVLNTMNS